MKLISMTEYVLEQLDTFDYNTNEFASWEYSNSIKDYANFLKKPLELGMFVTCDEDGNVLERPKRYDDYLKYPDSFDGNNEWFEFYTYQEAEERVLFKGFEINHNTPNTIWLGVQISEEKSFEVQYSFIDKRFMYSFTEYKTIEDLIPYGLELTANAIKQIGYKQ